MDADTLKTIIETVERLAYKAGAAEADRHAVARVDAPTIPAIVPAEHPTLARLRKAVPMKTNAAYADGDAAVFGIKLGDNVLWGELRAWAKEGGKA
jgi:hypothetical protein